MGLKVSDKGGDFTPAPAGNHVARCCWVVDLGYQSGQFGMKEQVLLGWELPTEVIPDGERKGEPFFLSQRFTQSLNERSNLRHALEAWRGRGFTDEELEAFDLEVIAGLPCMLNVIHETKDGKTRAKIATISSLPKGMAEPEAVNPVLVYNMDTPTKDTFDSLPEWVQKLLNEGRANKAKAAQAQQQNAGAEESPPPPDSGDDVPF